MPPREFPSEFPLPFVDEPFRLAEAVYVSRAGRQIRRWRVRIGGDGAVVAEMEAEMEAVVEDALPEEQVQEALPLDEQPRGEPRVQQAQFPADAVRQGSPPNGFVRLAEPQVGFVPPLAAAVPHGGNPVPGQEDGLQLRMLGVEDGAERFNMALAHFRAGANERGYNIYQYANGVPAAQEQVQYPQAQYVDAGDWLNVGVYPEQLHQEVPHMIWPLGEFANQAYQNYHDEQAQDLLAPIPHGELRMQDLHVYHRGQQRGIQQGVVLQGENNNHVYLEEDYNEQGENEEAEEADEDMDEEESEDDDTDESMEDDETDDDMETDSVGTDEDSEDEDAEESDDAKEGWEGYYAVNLVYDDIPYEEEL